MPTDLDTWKAARKATLEAEDGWLNLIARIDLPYGEHSLGSDPDCALKVPYGPEHLGIITQKNDKDHIYYIALYFIIIPIIYFIPH